MRIGLPKRPRRSTSLDLYRGAGLPERFIQHIAETPNSEMWYPTRDELIDAHVVTRVSLGGELDVDPQMRSRRALLLAVRKVPLYQRVEERFPGTIEEMVDRGWKARERGGNDADVGNAIRGVLVDILPKVLKTAGAKVLDGFASLFIDELVAARALSAEACAKLLAAQLDISKTLPPKLGEDEQKFLLRALDAPHVANPEPADPSRVSRALKKLGARLSPKYVSVVASPKRYEDQPALTCNATIAFFQAAAALPLDERTLVLRRFEEDSRG